MSLILDNGIVYSAYIVKPDELEKLDVWEMEFMLEAMRAAIARHCELIDEPLTEQDDVKLRVSIVELELDDRYPVGTMMLRMTVQR